MSDAKAETPKPKQVPDMSVKIEEDFLREALGLIPTQVQELWNLRNEIERYLNGGKVEGYTVPIEQVTAKITSVQDAITTRKAMIEKCIADSKTAPKTRPMKTVTDGNQTPTS